MRPTRSAVLLILDANGNIIADAGQTLPASPPGKSELKLPTVHDPGRSVAAELFAQRPASGSRALRIRHPDGTWQGFVSALSQPGGTLYLAIAAPHTELLADAEWIRDRGLLVAVALLALAVLCTFLVSRLAARQLDALTAEAKTIRTLRFDEPVTVRSPIAEIDTLAVTMAEMKSTIRRFLEIGAVLAGERNFERLLDRILTGTISLTAARGGIVYLTERDGSLTAALARWKDEPIDNPAPAIDARQSEHPAIRALREGSVMLQASGAEASAWFAALGHREPLATVAVPLRNRQAEPLGSLVLLYDTALPDDTGQRDMLGMVEAVSGAAASAIESQRLLREQKLLLQSFIELVAGAIDRKSPYTGGHCQRVPELTKMIARAAEAATAGPFAGFALNEQQWEELHIAAWLHDCGKVTSPEYVIDKATKLETIYDRLHEVRMRFEVVKREAEVACWRAIADGADRKLRLRELRAIWAELDEEFVFVAACNEGGEYMSPDRVERLKQIARRTWTRTLDDRIGLSEDEKRRKSRTPAAALPAVEPLLADRPDHIFERRDSDRIAPDNPWGIRVDVPEHLYNRGEIHNLSVSRGTLTAEDRYKINEHMVETVRMLSLLPLPSHLANVPEIACGHHEKMDGTGYPRRLKRDEMSVPARMMAIADIFEALTAADRPYKQGKKLSEALTIMARMRDDRHIDPDIFALFLRAGVYRDFAERHLAPAQIDHVDIADYLGMPVSAA